MPLDHLFFQRAILEVVLLSVAGGVLGTWIVLRGLSFFSHAVGTAAFPGLVLADGLGFAASLGAAGAAGLFALAFGGFALRERQGHDAATALVLVAALAAGVILASDVFDSGANVEALLFGSLLLIDGSDIALAALAAGVSLVATLLLGPRWLAAGFDREAAASLRAGSRGSDAVLLAAIALAAVASLAAVGALLATALLVVPAATTRLFCERMRSWQIATVTLAAAEGTGGLFISYATNAPPGATIAALSGVVFALAAVRASLPKGMPAAAALLGLALLAGCGPGESSKPQVSV
nr:metal ABC transporter permease [Thermoleophilaceae bacterium]